MLTFSQHGLEAERQMRAVIFYLTTFGYIDGDFDEPEKEYVRNYIRQLVQHRVESAVDASQTELRRELTQKFVAHFLEVFEGIDAQVRDLFTEAVAADEQQDTFIHAKLKLRCFEIFKGFDPASQEQLMETIDELIHADGQVHPAEVKFRGELAALLEDDLQVELIEGETARRRVEVAHPATESHTPGNHPLFEQFEVHYSATPDRLATQINADRALLDRTMARLEQQRAAGANRLAGKQRVSEFSGQQAFLDGHVYVVPPQLGQQYELTVLGDLHGCYSCLKAAIMQSRFLEKVSLFQRDPKHNANPKLVLLGDYIDRGIFSYNGVLRAVLQVFEKAADHVYVLRGNHEFYLEHQGKVYGAVRPSEAMETLKPHVPYAVFDHYRRLFEALPNLLLFDKFLFVHGGLPRDRLLKERYRDLGSLNDDDIRFQMMWSDPSSADVIPLALQEQSARFPFGRLQCLAFLQRIGCHTLIRGHEKVQEGFRRVYDDDDQLLITLFSAGGHDNEDLPEDSGYRSVTPMAMTLRFKDGKSSITPWRIDCSSYNDPDRNAFFRSQPEILHRAS
jgi:hypothetical protein